MLNLTDHPGLSGAIRGFIFLGTPHGGVKDGAGMSTSGEIYSAIVEANVPREDNILHSLMPENDNLASTVKNFTNSIRQVAAQPKIFCFFEQKSTNVGAIIGKNIGRVRI